MLLYQGNNKKRKEDVRPKKKKNGINDAGAGTKGFRVQPWRRRKLIHVGVFLMFLAWWKKRLLCSSNHPERLDLITPFHLSVFLMFCFFDQYVIFQAHFGIEVVMTVTFDCFTSILNHLSSNFYPPLFPLHFPWFCYGRKDLIRLTANWHKQSNKKKKEKAPQYNLHLRG